MPAPLALPKMFADGPRIQWKSGLVDCESKDEAVSETELKKE